MKKTFLYILLVMGFTGNLKAQSNKIFLKFISPVIVGNSTLTGYTDFFELKEFDYNQKIVNGVTGTGILTFEMEVNSKSPEIWLLHANATTPITFEVRFTNVFSTPADWSIYKFKNAYINSITQDSKVKKIRYSMYVGAYHLQYILSPNNSVSIGRDYLLNIPWNGQ